MPKADYTYSDPSNNASGSTPYGTYDDDSSFQSESIKVCKFVARRLGHPVMQLEFDSGSIYAMFEEAVNEYSTHINNFNTKNWMWNSYGSEATGSGFETTGTIQPVNPHGMGTTYFLSEQYGEAVNVGGNLKLYSGSISLTQSQQVYDLETHAALEQSGDRLEIQRVYNNGSATITRFYDPFAGSFDQRQMLDNFGMGNAAPAVNYILRPISHDIARASAIETSDKIRKSAYSFELVDNKIRIFPIPKSIDSGSKIWFDYYLKDDMNVTTESYTNNRVTDPSNMPYKFLTYNKINSTGKQWIRKYALALSKELLGIIRSKYASMPLPNGEVSLDGEGLKAEGREEKSMLLDELKEFLESVSLREQATAEQDVANANQEVLNKAPLGIYIG